MVRYRRRGDGDKKDEIEPLGADLLYSAQKREIKNEKAASADARPRESSDQERGGYIEEIHNYLPAIIYAPPKITTAAKTFLRVFLPILPDRNAPSRPPRAPGIRRENRRPSPAALPE